MLIIRGREILKDTQEGFTVIEILISLGLFSVIILGFSQMIVNAMKYQKEVILESAYTDLTSNLSQIINTAESCTDVLKGQNISGAVKIYKPGSFQSEILYEEGKEVEGWIIFKLQLVDSVNISTEKKVAKINVELERKNHGTEVIKKRSKDIFVQLSTNNSNKIEKCWATNSIVDSCAELGGIYDSNQNPQCSLKTTISGQTCEADQFVSGFDDNGKIICTNSPVKTVYISEPVTPVTVTDPSPATDIPGCAGRSATCTMLHYGVSGQVWATCDASGKIRTRASVKSIDSGWIAGTYASAKANHYKQIMQVTANAGSYTGVSGVITNGSGFYTSCSALF